MVLLSGMEKAKRIEVLLEFLVFGIIVGIAEDLLAVTLTTGEPITWKVIGIVVAVAIPFAFVGEIIADNVHIEKRIEHWLKRRKAKS